MGVKFANNAYGTLNASISSSDASLTLASGQGARFPSLGAGDYFYCTLIDTSNNLEVVKCTARSSDVLTITRAQESTTARAFTVGDRVELRVTAAGLEDATDFDAVVADDSINATKLNVSGNGTSGQYLISDGDGSFSWNTLSADAGLTSIQVFTSNGTWTKPSGIKRIKVYVTGGGGGGGGTRNDQDIWAYHGGSGGAGGTAIEVLDVSSVSSVSVTIGNGGSAGAAASGAGQTGGNGGTSSFGSYCSATGGSGGIGGGFNPGNSTGGDGGVGSGGDINLYGNGAWGSGDFNGTLPAPSGVASFWGGAGRAGANGSNSQDPSYHGAGGAGACGGSQGPGKAGGAGIVVVEEYK